MFDKPTKNENSAAETQQNSENAAKTQRAETEEEARLRTLYESEPEGKYNSILVAVMQALN